MSEAEKRDLLHGRGGGFRFGLGGARLEVLDAFLIFLVSPAGLAFFALHILAGLVHLAVHLAGLAGGRGFFTQGGRGRSLAAGRGGAGLGGGRRGFFRRGLGETQGAEAQDKDQGCGGGDELFHGVYTFLRVLE